MLYKIYFPDQRANLFNRDNLDWVPSVTNSSTPIPLEAKDGYEKCVMREKKCDAARSLLLFSDQFYEETEMDRLDILESCSKDVSCQTDMTMHYIEAMKSGLQQERIDSISLKEKV